MKLEITEKNLREFVKLVNNLDGIIDKLHTFLLMYDVPENHALSNAYKFLYTSMEGSCVINYCDCDNSKIGLEFPRYKLAYQARHDLINLSRSFFEFITKYNLLSDSEFSEIDSMIVHVISEIR